MKTLPPAPRPTDPARDTCCPSCGTWFRGRVGLGVHLARFAWCRLALADPCGGAA